MQNVATQDLVWQDVLSTLQVRSFRCYQVGVKVRSTTIALTLGAAQGTSGDRVKG